MKFQRIISRSFIGNDGYFPREIVEREREMLLDQVRRYLKENDESPALCGYHDLWEGGTEYCQCDGCARRINWIEESVDKNGDFKLELNFSIEDAKRIFREGSN